MDSLYSSEPQFPHLKMGFIRSSLCKVPNTVVSTEMTLREWQLLIISADSHDNPSEMKGQYNFILLTRKVP